MKAEAHSFSERHGYEKKQAPTEITIREEAPRKLRQVIVDLALMAGVSESELIELLVEFVNSRRQPWDSPVRHYGTPSAADSVMILEKWAWYWVYDLAEYLYDVLQRKAEAEWRRGHENSLLDIYSDETDDPGPDRRAQAFESDLNQYFEHAGIGWQLVDGRIENRGPEVFEWSIQTAKRELATVGRATAAKEIHEAMLALSRRPDPDCTGAISHALVALECVARDVTGDPKSTLGLILKKHPTLVPEPLKTAVGKLWGYASEKARHIQEGQMPAREEAELVVGLAANVATYLGRKSGSQK